MPTVPRVQGPQVGVSEGNAFRPMGFEVPTLPDQTKQIRQGVTKGLTALDKLIEQQDEARVTAALTELRKHAIDVESGDNGFRKLLGENALMPDDDGVGLVDRVDTNMHQFGDGLMAKLNDRQRKLFTERAQPIYLASYGSASQHVRDQGIAYAQNQTQASIDQWIESGAAYAGQHDKLAMANQGILEDVERLAQLQGLSEEQKANLLRKSQSGLYMNSIAAIMSNADMNPNVAYQALGVLQNHSREMLASAVVKAKTAINKALEVLDKSRAIEGFLQAGEASRSQISQDYGNLIRSGTSSNEAKNIVDAWHYGVLPEVSAGGHQTVVNTQTPTGAQAGKSEWRYGGSQMTVEAAMDVAKRHGISWDEKRFTTDRNYNQMLGFLGYTDKVTKYAGDQTMAMASWFGSDDMVFSATREAGKDGNAANWFTYLPKKVQEQVTSAQSRMNEMSEVRDLTGKKMSAFSPEYAMRAQRWQTSEQAREYFKATNVRAAANPQYLDELVTGFITRQNQMKASYAQEQSNRMASVLDILWQTNGDMTKIPPSMLSGLDVNQINELNKKAKSLALNEQASDPWVKSRLLTDDEYLLALPVDALKTYAMGSLSRDDFETVMYRRSQLQQAQIVANDTARQNMRDATVGKLNPDFAPSMSDVRAALRLVPGYAKMVEDSPQAAAQYEMVVMEEMTRQGMAQGSAIKDPLTLNQRVAQLTRNLVNIDDPESPAFALQLDDLPNASRSDAHSVLNEITRNWLAGQGIDRDPTDVERQYVLSTIMIRRENLPFVIPPTVTFDDALSRKIDADYRAKHNGQPMPKLQKLQAYFIERARGTVVNTEQTQSAFDNIYMDISDE